MSKTYYDPADLRKFGKITEWSEELGTKFFDYYGKVFEEGALSAREKSLIALAVWSSKRNYQRRNDGSGARRRCYRKWSDTCTRGTNDE